MSKFKLIGRILIVLSLLLVNFFPILGVPFAAESGAPDISGVTTVTWYVNATDDVSYNNDEFWTKDIQINSSGKMEWDNIAAYIDGNITVQSDGFFNLTNSLLNLSGNFSVDGIVNFDNVTLIMNCSYDNEHWLNVAKTGTFNVLNNSNITAYDKTTPIDLDKTIPGNESWGLHYNFTVHGNLTINNSYISYTYGNIHSYIGGIHLYKTAKASITNSTIFENEICGIYAEGRASKLIKKNHIYNAYMYGIYVYGYANPTIDDNIIETYTSNNGYGIVCEEHSPALIYRNTIRNNRKDGIFLGNYSNASIQFNTISNNNRYGINSSAYLLINQLTGQIIRESYNRVYIFENTITNNGKDGIHDVCGPGEILNNTISHCVNGSGIYVINNIWDRSWGNAYSVPGNITNNFVQYNSQYGIYLWANYRSTTTITMTLKNNTISNNDRSGVYVRGGLYQSNQYSPNPTIIQNTIAYNNHSGVLNYRALNYDLSENWIQHNNESGIICETNSRPIIENNYNISWNKDSGITTTGSSRPRVSYNNITHNSDNGISIGSGFNSQVNYNVISDNLGHGLASIGSNPNINNNQITNNNHSGVYLQGGSSTLSVRTNDITYNSWCGIETNNVNGQIRDNNLTNNSQDGIKLSGGSPVVDIDNLVNYNTWNGLACYQNARPLITRSEFQFNGKNGILLDSSSPRISAIAVKNMVKSNTMNGIVCINGSSGIILADITENTLDGVYTADTGTDTEILNSVISDNGGNGVNATTNSAPVITNSTISNNVGEAFWIAGSADPIALNDTFTDTDVWFEDTASTLTVQWHIFISTQSKLTGAPVGNVRVWMNSTTTSQVAWTGQSDPSGRIEWLEITEYVERDSNNNHRATDAGERTLWTPYDVTGDRRGYRLTHVSPNPVIDHSMTIVLELLSNNAPSGATNIRPRSTHNAHPTISWGPSSDPDGHSISYQVWVGPNINTSTIHESPNLITTSYSMPLDLDFNDDGNKTYYVTIVTTDDHGGQRFVTRPLYLLNSNPTEPEIEIEYSRTPSVELQWVRCKITTESIDPDGDEINYTYKWYKNEKVQSLLSEVETKNTEDMISINTDDIEFKKGDVWRVDVRAEDGLLDTTSPGGKSNWVSLEFQIGNLGPQLVSAIEDIVLDEDSESIDAIDLTTKFIDPDQTVGTLTYIATPVDVENLTVTINKQTHKVSFTPAENWNGKIRVNITCIDDEGLWVRQWINVTVKPVNDEPVIIKIGNKEVLSSIVEFLGDDAATEEEWFNITVEASDIDIELGEDDEITFNLIDDYEMIQLSHNQPLKATLSFFPTNDEVGSYEFMISIKDKSMKSYKQKIIIKIEVKNSNDKPELLSIKKLPSGKTYPIPVNRVLDLSKELDVKENEVLRLLVTATDPDIDEELTYHTDSVSIVEVDTNTGNPYTAEIIITPDEKSIGEFIFNITVKDRKLEKDTVQVILEIENVNDKPTVKIISPSAFELEDDFKPNTEILFEGLAEDKDIPYGDKLFYKWTSDKDGELAYNLSFKKSDLTIGEHFITFTAEDSYGESASILISIRIGGLDKDGDLLPDNWEKLYFGDVLKYEGSDDPDKDGYTNLDEYLLGSNPTDKNDPEKQPEEEESNLVFYASVSIMVIVIILVLVILLLFLLKTRKRKKEEEEAKRPLEIEPEKTKEDLYMELYGDFDDDAEPKPETGGTAKPGAPDKLTPTGAGAGMGAGAMPRPGVLPSSVPSQITTCPKCNTVMTFSPSGGLFCIKCGYRPEK